MIGYLDPSLRVPLRWSTFRVRLRVPFKGSFNSRILHPENPTPLIRECGLNYIGLYYDLSYIP